MSIGELAQAFASLTERVQAVFDIHKRDATGHCAHCSTTWPCQTMRALGVQPPKDGAQ